MSLMAQEQKGSVAHTVGNLKPQTFVSVSAVHAIMQNSAIPWNVLLESALALLGLNSREKRKQTNVKKMHHTQKNATVLRERGRDT